MFDKIKKPFQFFDFFFFNPYPMVIAFFFFFCNMGLAFETIKIKNSFLLYLYESVLLNFNSLFLFYKILKINYKKLFSNTIFYNYYRKQVPNKVSFIFLECVASSKYIYIMCSHNFSLEVQRNISLSPSFSDSCKQEKAPTP